MRSGDHNPNSRDKTQQSMPIVGFTPASAALLAFSIGFVLGSSYVERSYAYKRKWVADREERPKPK